MIRYVTQWLAFSCLLLTSLNAYATQQSFPEFIQSIKQQAEAKGISTSTIEAAFKDVQHLQRAVHHDRHQTQKKETFETYLSDVVNPQRVKLGVKNYLQYRQLLTAISRRYQVPPQYLLALWGLESNYGEFSGNYPEFSVLATLAYDKRRSEYFKKELFAALIIVDKRLVPLQEMKGSWAGAMGQCQFMPRNFLAYGVDYANKGHVDIWTNVADVLASTANFLQALHWRPNEQLLYPVAVTKPMRPQLIGLKFKQSIAKWQTLGVRPSNVVAGARQTGDYSLLFPAGLSGPAYLVSHHNYQAIFAWNHASYYAISVGVLANAINKNIKLNSIGG